MEYEFQHTAARRRLDPNLARKDGMGQFQHTAARRRLGRPMRNIPPFRYVSTHSRPKAAGRCSSMLTSSRLFQHTAARRRLAKINTNFEQYVPFQHTAARRRLAPPARCGAGRPPVSTHSRPKAAGKAVFKPSSVITCFNTQPPEGGWV